MVYISVSIECVCVFKASSDASFTKGFQGPNLWKLPFFMCCEGPSVAMTQDPIEDGGTDSIYFRPIYIYISGLCFREYPHNSYGQTYGNGTFTYLHLLDPGDLHTFKV